jgi:hypothetical protein
MSPLLFGFTSYHKSLQYFARPKMNWNTVLLIRHYHPIATRKLWALQRLAVLHASRLLSLILNDVVFLFLQRYPAVQGKNLCCHSFSIERYLSTNIDGQMAGYSDYIIP